MLGGSSGMNVMLYVRGNRRDYDTWEKLGNPTWGWNNVLEYFKKSEGNEVEHIRDFEDGKYHGSNGLLKVSGFNNFDMSKGIVSEAAFELGYEEVVDINLGENMGYNTLLGTIYRGERWSAAKAFLISVKMRENLHIVKNAYATKINFDDHKRAVSVDFEIGSKKYTATTKKEVVVSAGAINTPQLLLLSGVGPLDHLSKLDIPQITELPVGGNLQDHVGIALVYEFHKHRPNGKTIQDIADAAFTCLFYSTGMLNTIPGTDYTAFLNTKNMTEKYPDIQIHHMFFQKQEAKLANFYRALNYKEEIIETIVKANQEAEIMTMFVLLLNPKSKGKIELASNDPHAKPKIFANYLDFDDDVQIMIKGIRMMQKLDSTKNYEIHGMKPLRLNIVGCLHVEYDTDQYWECYLRHIANTFYHPVGTAKMGPDSDKDAVVDSRLRVKNVSGLRVADASIMPLIISGNTNAPSIMIGEKASDFIKEDWEGGCCGSQKKRTIVGGWAWAWWLVTDVQRLSLEVMTLNPMCEGVETAQGVPLTVTGVAQCKIMKADELLGTASEQFLGKSVKEIKQTILQTLEGHLRAILGTLTVEEVYKDRDQFAALVREVAAPDVGRMGIEILSFTIKDVYDDVQYLQSLGKAQTASVKRDADAGVAEANRDAGIREAECEKSAMDVKYSTDTKIEDNSRMFKLQKAQFDQEINTAKAESQLAYELQAAKIRQRIRNEEIQIDVVERKKLIEIEVQEVLRKEKELTATVRLPAEAESYKVQMIAEGKRTQTVESAYADAERIKKIGHAEAAATDLIGKAEAERMRMKAAVYKQYGDAAIMNIVLEALPKIAAEIAAPLAKTEEIVLIGGSDATTGDVARLVGQIPPAVSALTGVDLSKVLGKIPGAKLTA